jgi:hypothetical protein
MTARMVYVKSKYLEKHCNQCNQIRKHRLRRYLSKKQNAGYSCTYCVSGQDKKSRVKNWFSYLARKANSRKRIGSITLTKEHLEEIWNKQEQKCALTGRNLNIEDHWWKPSVDRIDSSLPYLLDNIRIVGWIVNHCRGDLTDEEFIDMCKSVGDYKK